ncbi:hypothetical protein PWP89_16275 [Stenotrophomonas rhizophila]|uniref:hypothetical protein n=1 Tax=Stenotrophomonas rhizophila TaxID=216778 RepID=UPI000B80B836|nr:hypothetical protein [Stenotrophomonas rhizophila]
MDRTDKIGNARQEALKALAEQVARAYREACCGFHVSAGLIQGNTLIAITAVFDGTGTECWVPLELGQEPWTAERRRLLEAQATLVLDARLRADRVAAAQVEAHMQEVFNAAR